MNGERNRNRDEIKDNLLLKLNYITVYSFISHFSIVLTFPAMTEAEELRQSL